MELHKNSMNIVQECQALVEIQANLSETSNFLIGLNGFTEQLFSSFYTVLGLFNFGTGKAKLPKRLLVGDGIELILSTLI